MEALHEGELAMIACKLEQVELLPETPLLK